MVGIGALVLSLALHFEPAPGGSPVATKYVAVSQRYTAALSETGVSLSFPSAGSVTMTLPPTRMEAEERQPGVSHYYAGGRPGWRIGVPHFARVRYRAVFPGIDLVVYGSGAQLEYDWIVGPGGDPARIHFSFQNRSHWRIDGNGDLVLTMPAGELRHRKPSIYQPAGAARHPVGGGFVELSAGEFGFRVDAYDRTKPLIFDPVMVFASGFGGTGYRSFSTFPAYATLTQDAGTGIAVDGAGNIYVTGYSAGAGFPLVKGFGPTPPACDPCDPSWQFVSKLSADGKTLLYSTFVAQSQLLLSGAGIVSGPPGVYDLPRGRSVAADSSGNVYLTGSTNGVNFPTVNGQPAATAGGLDAFVMKLNPSGQLVGSVLLGGTGDDLGNAIALGPDGSLYLAGQTMSSDFPITPGAYSSRAASGSAFVAKLNPALIGTGPSLSPIIYSTYFGASSFPLIGADGSGNAYVTVDGGLPVTAGAVQTAPAGFMVGKIDPSGTRLLYATYFGGTGHDYARGMAVDASGAVYLAGYTSSVDLPTSSGSLQAQPPPVLSRPSNYYTGFVAKLSPDATRLIYSTYLGGTSGYDYNYAVTVDPVGNAYVGGGAQSADFPIRNGIQVSPVNELCPTYNDPSSFIATGAEYCSAGGTLTVLNPTGSALVWSTFLGYGAVMDVAVDPSGGVYAAGMGILLDGKTVGAGASNTVGVVKIAPQGNPVQFASNGVTNAASFHPGLPGPGGLATLFVQGVAVSGTVAATQFPLPTTLAGVSIVVDGTPAPILAVADDGVVNGVQMQQINFQVPSEVSALPGESSIVDTLMPGAAHVVELRYGGLSTFASPETVGPGIFLLPDGTPAIQHAADYSLVTAAHPVVKGETIIVYATGLGTVKNGPPTGMPADGVAPVTGCSLQVAPGGGPALSVVTGPPYIAASQSFGQIAYAGLTPGTAGLYQLNVVTSASLPSGTAGLEINFDQCWPLYYAQFPPSNYFESNLVTVPVQ